MHELANASKTEQFPYYLKTLCCIPTDNCASNPSNLNNLPFAESLMGFHAARILPVLVAESRSQMSSDRMALQSMHLPAIALSYWR